MRFDLIIFDLDGTLVDSTKAITRSFKAAAMEVAGVSVSNAQIMAMIGMPLHDMFSRYVSGKVDQCVAAYRSSYSLTCVEGSKLYPDVEGVLRSLNATLAVATTKFTKEANILLDGMHIIKYFKFVCGMDMVKKPKPDPEVINKLLELSGVPKTRAVIVGDTTYDILAGKSACIKTVAVTYGFQNKETLMVAKPDFLIDSMKELQNISR